MDKELDDLKEKIDIIKDSFNDIMALVQGLKLRQDATEQVLYVRDILDPFEIDAAEDAIKEDKF